MARRTSAAGVTVPGARDALALHCRAFGSDWDSQRFTDLADALDRGDEITVSGDTLGHALYPLDPNIHALADHAPQWRLTAGADTLVPVDDTR